MNINKVYLCDIYELVDKTNNFVSNEIHKDDIDDFNLERFLQVRHKVRFRKKALVYYSDIHKSFIDLETKEKYKNSVWCSIGESFIDKRKEMISVSSIINSNRINMSKRKILKKYNEAKMSGGFNEHK